MIEISHQLNKYIGTYATNHGWYNGRKNDFKLKNMPKILYLPINENDVAKIEIQADCQSLASDILNIIFDFYKNMEQARIEKFLPTEDDGLYVKLSPEV